MPYESLKCLATGSRQTDGGPIGGSYRTGRRRTPNDDAASTSIEARLPDDRLY